MPATWRRAVDWLWVNAMSALACAGGAVLGWFFEGKTASLPQNWPEIGIGLVAAHVTRRRGFLGIGLVFFLTVDMEAFGLDAPLVPRYLFQFLVAAILLGQVLLGAHLLRIPAGVNPLNTRRGVLNLFVGSGIVAGVAGGLVRSLLGVAFGLSQIEIVTRFFYRLSKYVSGVMLVAPLAFMIALARPFRLSLARWAELVVLLVLLLVATATSSTDVLPTFSPFKEMLLLLILPLTLWITLRAGTGGAALAVFVACLFPIWGTLRGWSAFSFPATTTSEILIHIYLITVSITTLTIGAVLQEIGSTAAELREAKSDLEEKVRRRTDDLKQERDFGTAIFDTIGALVMVVEPDGTIVRFNKTSQDFVGRSFEEVAGKNFWELNLIPPEEVEMVKRRLESDNPVGENHLIAHDGTRRLFQWTNTRLGSPDGETFIISIGIDVTDRKIAQEEALEAIQARDLFLSVASHELRTPLTTLQLQLQALQRFVDRSENLPDEIAVRLRSALRQTRRLGGLIDELLDVSRIMHGRLAPERSRVDLSTVVMDVVDRYRIALEQSGSPLTVEGVDRPIVGEWDALRIDQIVDNLLSNAIKYGEGGPIEVEVACDDDHARIVVRDHGIGISPEDQSRIFGRFERAVSTRYYGGFGLGLWITRQVVEAHGGTIHVESELGEGSTFEVVLPLRPPETAEEEVGRSNGLEPPRLPEA